MPNESAKIILAVTNGKLSKVRDALAVEGTINALKCGFQFRTQDWDGTTKTAVFVRGRATPSTTNADITYIILDENNECDVPAEILEKDGMFSVGVFGESENYRIVSNWMCYKITDGCYADGSTPVDPGSSAYNQLIKMIKSKSDIGHNHAELYYTKDESEDRFVSQEELIGMMTTPDWNQNDETANDYIKNKPTIPTTLAELSDDDAHRTVTDIEKSEWNEKATKEDIESKTASIKPLIITLTQNDTGDYIADKTFVEISTAIKSGQTAILLDTTNNSFYPFIYLDEEFLGFGSFDICDSEVTGEFYDISVNDSIEYTFGRLNKIPNPNPLTLTGAVSATYDGSHYVNVNIPQGVTNEEVDSKIASLVNSAPETLDTLNELAEALGNDPNFATTIATQLGNKVDKVDGKGLSTNDYTDEDKDKLSNISPSDWNQNDETANDYIKNKPTKLSQFENDSMFTTSDDISSITPSIGDNGNWFVGSVDTGVVAKGEDGKGIKNISINDIVKDGFVTGKKCLTVIYSDDTKTEIQLPEIFNKDISIHEIDNGVCISYLDTNTLSEYNITNGRGIVSIDKTSTSGLVDTYTITYTDNTTSTFNVTNSVTKSEIEKLSGEVDTLHQSLVDYAKKSEIPAVPTKVSELQNDKNYTPISLGIRGAEVGNSVQIKSVDSNGQPTAWEPFDTYDDMRSFLDKEGLPEYAKKTEIPTKVSELQNDSGYLTEHQSLVEYAKKTEIPTVPTKVSELQNDSGYLTEHQSLVEYAKKTEIPAVPESLKNPNALTIKVGDTTTTYDGSEAKTIDVSTGESIPSYWLTHLQTKADKIREVMEAAGRNKSAFLFYTDVHWDAGEKKAPMLLK